MRRLYALLIATAVVFSAAYIWGVSQPPEAPPVEPPKPVPTLVTLGVITHDPVIDRHFDYIANVTIADVNEYASSNGYQYRFNYMSRKTSGINEALNEGVCDMSRTLGVEIFLGFDESESMCVSLSYAISNHMILMGVPLIHHDSSALPGDIMFRVAPNLRQITYATSSLVNELGAEGALVISRYDGWGSEIFYELAEDRARTEYENGTATVYEGLETVRYPGDAINCTSIIEKAATKIMPLIERYGVNNTVVVVVGGEEWLTLLSESRDRGGLLDVPWVVVELSEDPYTVEGELPDTNKMIDIGVNQTRIISLKREPLIDNEKYESLQASYLRENPSVMDSLSIMDASFHDSIWVACLSIMEANTTDSEVLKGIIPGVANGYTGASGRVLLDANGDRIVNYDVYEAKFTGGTPTWVKSGRYDAATGQVTLGGE